MRRAEVWVVVERVDGNCGAFEFGEKIDVFHMQIVLERSLSSNFFATYAFCRYKRLGEMVRNVHEVFAYDETLLYNKTPSGRQKKEGQHSYGHMVTHQGGP